MSDYAEMSHEDLVVRVVVLEGILYSLIEGLAQQAGAEKGMEGVNSLVQTLGFAVGERSSNLPPGLKEATHAHFVSLLQTLQDRLAPSQSGIVRN